MNGARVCREPTGWRADFTLELVGRDADGRTVVTSTGHYQVRPNRG